MPFLTKFLTGLLSDIIRPILREELQAIKNYYATEKQRLKDFEKHDAESQVFIKEMADASTSEERYAILQKLHNSRPGFSS